NGRHLRFDGKNKENYGDRCDFKAAYAPRAGFVESFGGRTRANYRPGSGNGFIRCRTLVALDARCPRCRARSPGTVKRLGGSASQSGQVKFDGENRKGSEKSNSSAVWTPSETSLLLGFSLVCFRELCEGGGEFLFSNRHSRAWYQKRIDQLHWLQRDREGRFGWRDRHGRRGRHNYWKGAQRCGGGGWPSAFDERGRG